MKRIEYVTGGLDELRWHPAIERLESMGYNVELSKDVPYEPSVEDRAEEMMRHFKTGRYDSAHNPNVPPIPKPEFERCEIIGGPRGRLVYFRSGENPNSLVGAMDDASFAGYEFDDGTVDRCPWKHSNNGDRCYSANFVDVRAMFAECAKYVLFRL